MTDTALVVKNLTITHPARFHRSTPRATADTVLVDDMSLTLNKGERLGLIGESGSGKSLTALSLLGLVPPPLEVTGSITFGGNTLGGVNMVGASDRSWRTLRGSKVAMVFQEPMTALNPVMTVGRQVAEVFRMHHIASGTSTAKKLTLGLFEDVRLDDPQGLYSRYPHELSGGQRQRVMIAMALAAQPDIIVCDEPTTALDVAVQADIVSLIGQLVSSRGMSLIFITHDLGLVAQTTDNICVLNHGRIVESGTTKQILTQPTEPYTKALLAASDLSARDANGHLFTASNTDSYSPGVVQATPEYPPVGRALITATGVSKTYRTGGMFSHRLVPALKPVDMTISAGQRLGIVGGSGSGKSTLIKLIAGLTRPTTGTITRADTSDDGFVQVVFQDPMGSFDPKMTVGQSVAEPLVGIGVSLPDRTRRVAQVLEEVGIDPALANRYPHEFSGGQRQRISIARALTVRPKVLLADEAVSALDVSVRAQVLNLLSDLVISYGLALVFVSHDLNVVRQVCADVMVLDHGSVIESGPTSRVLAHPQHEQTARLVAAIPTLAIT